MAKKTSSIMDDIQQYIGNIQPMTVQAVIAPAAPPQNNDKVSMDMKILQNRIDSVSIIQYYRDLKNELFYALIIHSSAILKSARLV